MGEDEDLVSWIRCNFCGAWYHGACVGLKFDTESAEGIVKFKCPECRKDDPSNDSDYSSNPEDFVEEREELLRKLDKLNILVDQERREVENLKEKEKEHIRKFQEEKVRKEDQIKTKIILTQRLRWI